MRTLSLSHVVLLRAVISDVSSVVAPEQRLLPSLLRHEVQPSGALLQRNELASNFWAAEDGDGSSTQRGDQKSSPSPQPSAWQSVGGQQPLDKMTTDNSSSSTSSRSNSSNDMQTNSSHHRSKSTSGISDNYPHAPSDGLKTIEPNDDVVEAEPEAAICQLDLPLGERNSCSCTQIGDELILEQDLCLRAADAAGVDAPNSHLAKHTWFQQHPKGCFSAVCEHDSSKTCYFFNPVGGTPSGCPQDVQGTPVCKRPAFQNGTVDTNGGCPERYEPIRTSSECSKVTSCLDYCQGQQFEVSGMNISVYDQYPTGCFINRDDGCVYFNPPDKTPRSPVGTPICKAASASALKPRNDISDETTR